MRFKLLFLIFNIFFLAALCFLILAPFAALDRDFAVMFWRERWYLFLTLILIAAASNVWFAANSKLLSLMEEEDWPALAAYLEAQIFVKKRISRKYCSLYINAAVMTCSFEEIIRLADFLKLNDSPKIKKYAAEIQAAYILKGDYSGAIEFFRTAFKNPRAAPDWSRFLYGFALFLSRGVQESAAAFLDLAKNARGAPVKGLAAYMCAQAARRNCENANELENEAAHICGDIAARISISQWDKTVEKEKNAVCALILGKLLEQTREWLYGIEIAAKRGRRG